MGGPVIARRMHPEPPCRHKGPPTPTLQLHMHPPFPPLRTQPYPQPRAFECLGAAQGLQ
jgi:hypothetical protein